MEKSLKRFLNVGLLTGLVLSFGFTSCSSDDDDDSAISDRGGSAAVINGKRLVAIVEGNDTVRYEYNSAGQIVKVTDGDDEENYVYEDTKITYTQSGKSSSSRVYLLTNGRITEETTVSNNSSSSTPTRRFTYDADGQLVKVTYSRTDENSYSSSYTYKTEETQTEEYTWADGNVVMSVAKNEYKRTTTSTSSEWDYYSQTYKPVTETSWTSSTSTSTRTFTYSEHANTLPFFGMGSDEVLAWQGYFGKSLRQMPSRVVREYTSSSASSDGSSNSGDPTNTIYTYDYTIENGVVTKFIEQTTGQGDRARTTIINLVWQ